jgi:V/A-type H+-transporting ATPase subunit A
VGANVRMNEVGYVMLGDQRLKSEVIRIRGNLAELQVFEMTRGIGVNDKVEFTSELLAVELGPGLLGQIFDGLQNPLPQLAEQLGFFLGRGVYIEALPTDTKWSFTPKAKVGDRVGAADTLGTVPEGIFAHRVMVPFYLTDSYRISEIADPGEYTVKDKIAVLEDERGSSISLDMTFKWPVKRPIKSYVERLKPTQPLVTNIRIIDTLFPVARGGTYCIPGPFGSGKTVLQQLTSRYADVDIIIVAACGERAGEVVETLREFPELIDPRTGRSLMERTIIICNTSSMPVAAREASVYTAVTLAEYYRQMGLNILLLADSTSRWAQAMREMSGRLEEIPGEEAFPAYLESVIASFYERAGIVRLKDGSKGSVTIGGTVSPAGGNFEEPVTQATLKVVGAFHGLSRERSDARRYPAIHPLESWSKYHGIVPDKRVSYGRQLLYRGNEINQMMKVVGEEGTSLEDYIIYLKSEFLDAVYLQQNAFDPVDASTSDVRQRYVFDALLKILLSSFEIADKAEARTYFYTLRQHFLDLNGAEWDTDEFSQQEAILEEAVAAKRRETREEIEELFSKTFDSAEARESVVAGSPDSSS